MLTASVALTLPSIGSGELTGDGCSCAGAARRRGKWRYCRKLGGRGRSSQRQHAVVRYESCALTNVDAWGMGSAAREVPRLVQARFIFDENPVPNASVEIRGHVKCIKIWLNVSSSFY